MRGFATLLYLVPLFIGLSICRVDVFFVDSYDVGTNNIVVVLQSAITPATNISQTSFFTDPVGASSKNIIGGERDLQLVALTGAAGRVFSTSVTIVNGTGQWEISTPNGASSQIQMQYDGIDGSINLDTRGLGGLDLTVSGAANGLHVIVETDIATEYTFQFYDTNGGLSSVVQDVPAGNTPVDTQILYSRFSGNANFNSIGAIVVKVEGLQNVDTITTLFAASGDNPSTTPSATRSPRAPSPSNSPDPEPSATKSTSLSRTPRVPASESRTPTTSASPSPFPTCQCNCPNFRCGIVFDRPDSDDDDISGHSSENTHVIYRPVYYYAANHDFDGIEGDDDGQSTFVVISGRVAQFKYGYDDVAVYLYLSDASTLATSFALILMSLLALVF